MPTPLLCANKKTCQDDEHILVDGDKRAHVHPTKGVTQGDRVNGVLYMQYADDLSLTTKDPGLWSEKRADYQYIKVGMIVDKYMILKVSEEHAVQPYMAA
eukprot:1144038-Pelagomonas_calceolata.AAC.4